jgi:Spy/CpxP family protein refolding chaperone
MGGRKMKKKMVGIFSLLACLLIIFALSVAYAGHEHQGKQRRYGLEKKIYHKLRLVIVNQDELNLSDKQVEKIEDLKINVKKDLIKRNAEIDLIGVDIKSRLRDEKIDKKAINSLIDRKYELKKAKAKSLIDVLVELKNILSEEQEKKLKDIWLQSRKMRYRSF